MLVAVSPYYLSTREAPAIVALQLAERVVTMLPAPVDRADLKEAHVAAGQVPAYLAFMKSWAWTEGLWRAGVLVAEVEGQSAVEDMHEVFGQVVRDEHLAPLRHFMHEGLAEDERLYLSALAADVLKGGPDPGISVPVMAGMDRFATRLQLLVARPQPSSVVQVTEAKMGLSLSAVALPVLVQADADRLLHAREVMADVLGRLQGAFDALALAACEVQDGLLVSSGVPKEEAAEVEAAGAAYAAAYEARREDLIDDGGADEVRLVEGTARVAAIRMPADIVLRSSLAAVAGFGGRARQRGSETARQGNGNVLPVAFDPLVGRAFVSLMIKPLGAGVPRRR